ncbi:MAG: HNH endonuclease [Chloroflexota bacterium]|nr:HNH endonuclease [Chloroflexota bacterium]MBI5349774.1 HNH endonuclease [Chloroflexota bacterium]MBI5712800.1 HNH endonuclease [Chloroflexota bacterium]
MEVDLNRAVLVLNANYEPLHVCSTKRAVGLLVTGKAELMVNGRGHIRTTRLTYPAPSVIRLEHMIKRPRPRVKLSKREIFRRDNYTCQYCGRQTQHLTIDHVIPRHKGGGHEWDNLVAACPPCNRRKGGRNPVEAQMHLKRKPAEPNATPDYLFSRHIKENMEWEKFIKGW